MDDKLFESLMESVTEAGAIRRGEAQPARVTKIDDQSVQAIRESMDLTQSEFAEVMHVSVNTIRNWEQGRRQPDGAAAALLTAVKNDPENVLRALHAG